MKGDSTENRSRRGRAIAPLIGVLLMIAITAVLAVFLGMFVFGFGMADSPPTTDFDFEETDTGDIQISVDGGDVITAENTGNLSIAVDGSVEYYDDAPSYTAGDEITTVPPGNVDVIWESPDGTTSEILVEYQA